MSFNVLIACEESQSECLAFRRLGCNAFSCDLQMCSGNYPEYHIMCDVKDVMPGINKDIEFYTVDGLYHFVNQWDLIIAHPPCTFLTVAGACNIPRDPTRIDKGFLASDFFNFFLNYNCNYIAVENPIIMKRFPIRKYDQKIHPYMFGETCNKPICLWLKNLPFLVPTSLFTYDYDVVERFYKGKRKTVSRWYYNSAGKNSSLLRSKSFDVVSNAMASQWIPYILRSFNYE